MYKTDTDLSTLEAQLRLAIHQSERLGFSATAAAMRAVLSDLLAGRQPQFEPT